MNAALKAFEKRERERLLARRTYTADAELIAFFRKRAPKSEATIRLESDFDKDDGSTMERLNERAEQMARAAERSKKFAGVTFTDLIDAAGDYLCK